MFTGGEHPGFLTKKEKIDINSEKTFLIKSLRDRQQYHDPDQEAQSLGIGPADWTMIG